MFSPVVELKQQSTRNVALTLSQSSVSRKAAPASDVVYATGSKVLLSVEQQSYCKHTSDPSVMEENVSKH